MIEEDAALPIVGLGKIESFEYDSRGQGKTKETEADGLDIQESFSLNSRHSLKLHQTVQESAEKVIEFGDTEMTSEK